MTAADPRDGLQALLSEWRQILSDPCFPDDGDMCAREVLEAVNEQLLRCADQLEAALAHARPEAVDATYLLRDLVEALDSAFISSWQSTAEWSVQLSSARDYLATLTPDPTP